MNWWTAIIVALIGAAPPSVIAWLAWRDVRSGVKFHGETSDKKISDLIALLSKKRNRKK